MHPLKSDTRSLKRPGFSAATMVQSIIRSYREAGQLAVAKVRELSIDIATDDAAKRRDMLVKCAMTSMNSKLVRILGIYF